MTIAHRRPAQSTDVFAGAIAFGSAPLHSPPSATNPATFGSAVASMRLSTTNKNGISSSRRFHSRPPSAASRARVAATTLRTRAGIGCADATPAAQTAITASRISGHCNANRR